MLKNVPKIGKKDEIKDLQEGYVRNFLIPQKLAVIATPEAIKKLERSQSEIRVEREVQSDLFKKNLRAVQGLAVTIPAKANAEGKLFQAVHIKDVVAALKKDHRVMLDEHFVHMEPIKHVGAFTASVEALGMKETVNVTVVAGK